MNVRRLLRTRLESALAGQAPADQVAKLADMLVPSQDAKFGDYQINCAMPLGKQLGRPPRDVATELAGKLNVADVGQVEPIAGPGFINLRLSDAWLAEMLQAAVVDDRLGIPPTTEPKTYVVDYSGPNVAKPMHVGHIRSTVIGDAIYRTLKFMGHVAIGDNHLGDWGTQFGMIIYGYKNFRDDASYQKDPLNELARLYRYVNKLIQIQDTNSEIPRAEQLEETAKRDWDIARQNLIKAEDEVKAAKADMKTASESSKDAIEEYDKVKNDGRVQRRNAEEQVDKALDAQTDILLRSREAQKLLTQCKARLEKATQVIQALRATKKALDQDVEATQHAITHTEVGQLALSETAKLHSGDAENLGLWEQFKPICREAIDVVYRRLGVTFDETLGESEYHNRLAEAANDLERRGIAKMSDGALCIFLPDQKVPMIIRKKDGAFLYATTDLATIRYRMEELWKKPKYAWPRPPDAMLYVVDHRQSLHFEQLFAASKLWGYDQCDFRHLSFGTVLGKDGKPYKTRSGDTVGLMGLLDEAVERALKIVSENDDGKPSGAELDAATRKQVAETVGIGALKYSDLSQNRTSDYEFSYDKMLAMTGNTATYMQYAYARVRSIFRRGGVDVAALRTSGDKIALGTPAERALGVALLRFEEAIELSLVDFRPNLLTAYLFDLANAYSTFFEQCPVLKAPSDDIKNSRLLLCDLTARTIQKGLSLLGIDVVEQM